MDCLLISASQFLVAYPHLWGPGQSTILLWDKWALSADSGSTWTGEKLQHMVMVGLIGRPSSQTEEFGLGLTGSYVQVEKPILYILFETAVNKSLSWVPTCLPCLDLLDTRLGCPPSLSSLLFPFLLSFSFLDVLISWPHSKRLFEKSCMRDTFFEILHVE